MAVGFDNCNCEKPTSGERGKWSDTDSWDYSECKTAAREVVGVTGKSELRIEEWWIHQSSNERCRQWQTELEPEPEVEAVADNWNGYRGPVESILHPLGLASMADDLYCKVSVDLYSHC